MVTNKVFPIIPAERLIPPGPYCYTALEAPSEKTGWSYKTKPCPFWSIDQSARETLGAQSSGYCSYLDSGDWMEEGTMLLWDQVKECGVNADYDEGADPQ